MADLWVHGLAIFKAVSSSFQFTADPSFFTFFLYSFKAALFTSIDELRPVTQLAYGINMLENFFAFLTVAVFISVLISVRHQREHAKMDEVIDALQKEGERTEAFIRDEYRLASVEDALAELTRLQSKTIKFLLAITRNLG